MSTICGPFPFNFMALMTPPAAELAPQQGSVFSSLVNPFGRNRPWMLSPQHRYVTLRKKVHMLPQRRIFSHSVCHDNKKQLRLNDLVKCINMDAVATTFTFNTGNSTLQCNVRNSVTVTVFAKHLGDIYYSKYPSTTMCTCSGCHRDQTLNHSESKSLALLLFRPRVDPCCRHHFKNSFHSKVKDLRTIGFKRKCCSLAH